MEVANNFLNPSRADASVINDTTVKNYTMQMVPLAGDKKAKLMSRKSKTFAYLLNM